MKIKSLSMNSATPLWRLASDCRQLRLSQGTELGEEAGASRGARQGQHFIFDQVSESTGGAQTPHGKKWHSPCCTSSLSHCLGLTSENQGNLQGFSTQG